MAHPRIRAKIETNYRQDSPCCYGSRGFTLVELLIVLAIMAVLAAVVIPNVTGIFGRGAEQAYATDRKNIQSVLYLFFWDGHACDTQPASDAWDSSSGSLLFGHYFPTSTAFTPNKTITQILSDANTAGSTYTFPTEAIWMGLLYNTPSSVSTHDRDNAAPLSGEMGPYLNEVSESASSNNYSTADGSYTWVVTKDGLVYGVYWDGSAWQEGFNGTYP